MDSERGWTSFDGHRLRGWRLLHTRQLGTPATHWSTDTFKRSAFGLVHFYNSLPQCMADKASVKSFQASLQKGLCRLAAAGGNEWQQFFTTGWRRLSRQDLDKLFG